MIDLYYPYNVPIGTDDPVIRVRNGPYKYYSDYNLSSLIKPYYEHYDHSDRTQFEPITKFIDT